MLVPKKILASPGSEKLKLIWQRDKTLNEEVIYLFPLDNASNLGDPQYLLDLLE